MGIARPLIFLGSFLGFFVQPMVGRLLLPYFGGAAAVWVTCLAVFQFLFLLGYGYAFVPARTRGRSIHLMFVGLAAIAAFGVPFSAPVLLPRLAAMSPVLGVVVAVLSLAGLVSVILSANSTTVQSWVGEGREVYRLYSVSNAGSLAGLLSYPLLVEPFVSVPWQWIGLGVAIAVYGAGLARVKGAGRGALGTMRPTGGEGGALGGAWLWFLIPAVSCGLMTSATTYLTTDIVALPLVWAVLLSAFLLSYVIGFSRVGERLLPVWMACAAAVLAFAAWALMPKACAETRFCANGCAVLLLLLVVCTALHAWLFSLRPATVRLPHYYFAIALGGCLGGVASGIVPAAVFTTTYEYPIALVLACAAVFLWAGGVGNAPARRGLRAVLALVVLVVWIDRGDHDASDGKRIFRDRDFYGVVTVERQSGVEYAPGRFCDFHVFRHGKTDHGAQLRAEDAKRKPTVYYSLNGGGIAFSTWRRKFGDRPFRAAIVGMGMGTLAVYGREGDYFRMYEISPAVIGVATNAACFSFLADCPAKVDIVEGDARLRLEQDRAGGIGKFDIIVIDVYSGDSVPGHLVTKEAFELFASLLKDDGVLAFHISNWHIDLYSVMKAAARHLGFNLVETVSGAVLNEYASETSWAFMTRGEFEPYMPNCCHRVDLDRVRDVGLMSDDRGSLVYNIRLGHCPEFEE